MMEEELYGSVVNSGGTAVKRQKGLLQHNLAPMFLLLKANLLKKKKSYSGKYLRRNAVKRLFGSIFYNLL